jgi:3-methyladenine DNA glycosylase/8-oxoguanine DNA glycosylase
MNLSLTARPPFSLPAVINSHGWIQLPPFDRDADCSTLTYVTRLETDRVVELVIRQIEQGVNVQTPVLLNQVEQAELRDQVRWMLGLGQDFSEFYALIADEPKLAHMPERAQGRVLRSPNLFEDIVKTILTTNTTWRGTIRMVSALVNELGTPSSADPARRAFPAPEQIAALDEETLRSAAGLGYRAPYVLALSRAVAKGDLDLESWKVADIPTDELRQRLLAIKGVGSYAAANLLMLLGRYDFVPVDSWARTLVSHEWHDGEPVGRAEVEAAFERWGEWKGLAYWFWHWSPRQDG